MDSKDKAFAAWLLLLTVFAVWGISTASGVDRDVLRIIHEQEQRIGELEKALPPKETKNGS